MEFSYRISEAEYQAAWKLRNEPTRQRAALKTILFWVFILICLTLLWSIAQRGSHQTGTGPVVTMPAAHAAHVSAATILRNVLPFLVLLGVWLAMARSVPSRLRLMYRKDPAMQGEFTVNVTPQSISTRNTAGASTESGWNIYEYWRERNNLIVLDMVSGTYFTLNLAGLSEPKRAELRGILAQALPKK